MKPLHLINELVFDVSFSTKKAERREQENIQNWIVESLLVEVDQLFTQYSNTQKVLRFDQLIIDVGRVSSQNYQHQISQKVLSKLMLLISEQLLLVAPQKNSIPIATESANDLVLTPLLEFLYAGYTSRHHFISKSSVHEELLSHIIKHWDIPVLLRTLPDSAVIVKRLVQQFSQRYLAEILQQLCPAQFESVLAFLEVVEFTDFSSVSQLQKKDVLNLLWEQLLLYFIAHKLNDSLISSWVKPVLSKFANALSLTERQLLMLIDGTSRQYCHHIDGDVIAHILAGSIVIKDVSSRANIAVKPQHLSLVDQLNNSSLEPSVSISTIQQIEFLLTNAFVNEDLDFILLYWPNIRAAYSSVALKIITYFMGSADYRKKLIDQLPDAYLIDFVFLMQPQLLKLALPLIKNVEKLHVIMVADNTLLRTSFASLGAWKTRLWEAFFNVLGDQRYSTLDSKTCWQYLIKELLAPNNLNLSIIENQWVALLGDDFKQLVVNGNSTNKFTNSNSDEQQHSSVQIGISAKTSNDITAVSGYFDLKLLNEQQVHQFVSHAMAGMDINFLVVHWDTLQQNFQNVLLNNLRHYFNRLELRQDIIANLPEALLLDTIKLLNPNIYSLVSVLISNAEFLYRVNAEAHFYPKEEVDSLRNASLSQWKTDIWHVCFSVLFNRFNAQNTYSFLVLHVLESLSHIYHFDIQVVAPQWLSLCDGLLPASASSSFTEKNSALFGATKLESAAELESSTELESAAEIESSTESKNSAEFESSTELKSFTALESPTEIKSFTKLEGSAEKQTDSELILVERYLFCFERSHNTLDVLLSDLAVNTLVINRLYRHIELHFTSLSSIQLSLNDWLTLIQCYIGLQSRQESADLLKLFNEKVDKQAHALDYCYQIFARLLKSNEDNYKTIIENYNPAANDGLLNEFPTQKSVERISDEREAADQNVLSVERVLIDRNKPTDKNALSAENFPVHERNHLFTVEQQPNAAELEHQGNKELLDSLKNGVIRLDVLNLSSNRLMNMVAEFIDTNSVYLASFKVDLLASIHSHAKQIVDLHSFYTSVLNVLLTEQILDLEAIVNEINAINSLGIRTLQNIKNLQAISLKNLHQPNSENVLSLCEQLRSKSINIMQVNGDEADLWRLLVAYLESDKSILNDFCKDMLAAFSSRGQFLINRSSYYRKIIAALVDGDILDLEDFAKSVGTIAAPIHKQSPFNSIAQTEINKTIFEQGRRDMKVDSRTQEVKRKFDLQDLIYLLQDSSELTSSQIVELQKIISIALKSSGLSDEEWESIFSVKNLAEKFVCYVPSHILHQLFLRLRPQAYQVLDELVIVVLGVLALLIPSLNSRKIHQAKWLCIAELLFGLSNNSDEDVLLKKLSYNLGAAADIEDLQRLLNLVQRRRALLRPVKSQQAQFSQEKILETIKNVADSNALAVGLHVNNVGLVLVAPYLPRLLSMLELVKNGKFIHLNAADRAVHLMQYIVTGQSQTVEYELVLNKILCGISTSIPISFGIEITEQEKTIVEQMLTSIIQHWNVLGTTSIAGLRETFFQRQGWLRLEDDAWHLEVKEGTFDMLIDHIPWSFSLIKYGWMDKPLHVKWRSKD